MPLTFLWPALLWGFLLIPLLVLFYVRLLRSAPRNALSFPDVATVTAAIARGGRVRRHLPAMLLLLALTAAIAAVARPVAMVPAPSDRATIMLSMDVSGSMRSQDITPSRMEASRDAARTFLRTVPPRVRVGLTTFAGFAITVVPPVTDRQRVFDAIDALGFMRRTAIGEGLLEAMAALPGRVRPAPDGTQPPAPPGPRPPGVVILMSDGVSNTGIDPREAAQVARQQEVIVYTVGVGQTANTGAWTVGGTLDEDTLREIADVTGGRYFHATSAQGLNEVYRHLARTVGWERRREEVSGAAAGLGLLALLAAFAISRVTVHPIGL